MRTVNANDIKIWQETFTRRYRKLMQTTSMPSTQTIVILTDDNEDIKVFSVDFLLGSRRVKFKILKGDDYVDASNKIQRMLIMMHDYEKEKQEKKNKVKKFNQLFKK